MSEMFNSGSVDVSIQWSNPPVPSGVSYDVSVTPPIESAVMIRGTSAQLTVMYNIRYNVSIVATNCAGESVPFLTQIFYGKFI